MRLFVRFTKIARTCGVLPWAILPEVDYLVASELGSRAHAIGRKYRALNLGFVDAVVIATAERLRADAIATLDLRHFGAVKIALIRRSARRGTSNHARPAEAED